MAWSGSGTFTRVFGAGGWTNDKNNGVKILASRHDTNDQDLADGVNACLTRNNESKPTSDFLPAADNTLNLGSGSFRWASFNGATFSDFARISQENFFSRSESGQSIQRFTNLSAGTSAISIIQLGNDTAHLVWFGLTSSTFATPPWTGGPTGEQFFFGTDSNAPISIATNSVERIRIAGDGSVINLQATAVQVGGVQVATQETGTFTGTLVGCTTSPTATINYRRAGNIVTLWFTSGGALTGTSNAITLAVSGIPAAIRPNSPAGRIQYGICLGLTDNGSTVTTGVLCSVGIAGLEDRVTFYNNFQSGGFTSSGTKGITLNGFSITYGIG